MREKMIELLKNSPYLDVLGGLSYYEEAADYLIANGVTIATDNNVGDKSAPTDKDINVPSKWMTSELALAFERAKDPLPRFLMKENGDIVPLTNCQQWISVNDRLPDLELVEVKTDDNDLFPCLAARKHPRAKNGIYTAKAWYDGYGFIDGISNDVTDEVTHWMPLPQPPKGE